MRLAVACLVALTLAGAAHAQQIPRDAYRYQRALIGHARFVWGLDAPIALLAAQVHQESGWRADAKSPVGAQGLSQFMPPTSAWIATMHGDLASNEPLNPSWALRAMLRYDQMLWRAVYPFDSDCSRFAFALSDYNGGAGWRKRRQVRSADPGNYATTSLINPGITPANQRENEQYPRRILLRWQPLYASWGPAIDCSSHLTE